jgi:exodeoxyribonuclease VII large subunit
MIEVISRRWRAIEILIWPVRVQGDGAAREIAQAIEQVNGLQSVDVMVVGRGGGSLEDLWAFNEEVVARAIFGSRVPVISAVGHEVDWTIADFVADLRAPTPSVAAEKLVPSESEIRELLDQATLRMTRGLRERLRTAQHRFEQLSGRRPFQLPLDGIMRRQQHCDNWAGRLDRAIWNRLRDGQHRMARIAAMLDGLSPLNILARGYSLTTREDGHTVVRDAREVAPNDRIITRLRQGVVTSRVEAVEPDQRE